ncbi:hypothetical protein [Lentzea cavernae]|uniref:hypothetical protein n=1 Tax=Lentzea cavernae TaxID=2020703 RepID=UPI0017480E12|nr:hypothetical protein [Lentzea cavernae]
MQPSGVVWCVACAVRRRARGARSCARCGVVRAASERVSVVWCVACAVRRRARGARSCARCEVVRAVRRGARGE